MAVSTSQGEAQDLKFYPLSIPSADTVYILGWPHPMITCNVNIKIARLFSFLFMINNVNNPLAELS
jgi:hypothetical protein